MKIVGCDLHTRYRQVAMLDQKTGELIERRLEHENGEARAFYAALSAPVRVGIEATGHTRWFERMLAELGHELWIGDGAEIRASMVRKQKTDARDAAHLLDLLVRSCRTCSAHKHHRPERFPGGRCQAVFGESVNPSPRMRSG
jgi:transposase